MDLLKRHYEKLILALFLLGLLGGSWLLLAGIRKVRQEVGQYRMAFRKLQTPEKGQMLEPLKPDEFHALAALTDPALVWEVKSSLEAGDLMNPRRYMRCANPLCHNYIPYEAEICPFCHTPQGEKAEGTTVEGQDSDGDGIPDEYENKYEFLNPNVATDAYQDEDGDWFTNLDEFKAGTKPDDPKDHPDLATRLRYIRTVKKPLGIVFTKIVRNGSDDPADWDIFVNVYDEKKKHWKTRVRRVGETVGNYKILEARYKTEVKYVKELGAKVPKDVSEIVLQKVKTENKQEEPIVLKRKEQAFERGVAVQFILLNDLYSWQKCKVFSVVEGDPFELEDSEGRKYSYILKRVDKDKVIVNRLDKNGKIGKEFVIPPLNPAKDFVRLQAPAAVTPGAGGAGMMGPAGAMGPEGMMMGPGAGAGAGAAWPGAGMMMPGGGAPVPGAMRRGVMPGRR